MKFRCGNTIFYANYCSAVGDETGKHSHSEDGHVTVCIKGELKLERFKNGNYEYIDLVAGAFALIEKDVEHNVITAIEDSAYLCVWSLMVDEKGIALAHQTIDPDLILIDTWKTLDNAPWLNS